MMSSNASILESCKNSNLLDLTKSLSPCSVLDHFDWSSVNEVSDESSETSLPPQEFKPIKSIIFKKASRRWLSSTTKNFFSQSKNTLDLKPEKISSAKFLQSFENYLSIVALMYFGDPFNKNTSCSESFRPVKRPRSSPVSDTLTLLVSPLRAEYDFESWSPKEIAVFESSLCKFGKNFEAVERFLNSSKSKVEVTRFYYAWKKTSHYKAWKEAVVENTWKGLS